MRTITTKSRYQTIWFLLLIAWMVSGADRAISGPVVTWMIQNKVSFMMSSAHPYALGGLIGSVFFTAYMLTQFPGGYFGDRYGHRTVIVLSLIWAGLATIINGFFASLIGFVILRVLTGLGEGMYYANDRTLISEVTPPEKLSLGLGVAIVGLSLGMTAASILPPYLIHWGNDVFGTLHGWKMPLFVLGGCTVLWGIISAFLFRREALPQLSKAFLGVGRYTVVFFILIMAVFIVADRVGLPSWLTTLLELVFAVGLILFAYFSKGRELSAIVKNKDLMYINVAGIAVLWNLWFFGFWSVAIVEDSAHSTFLKAALTATFNAVAGVVGYPVGGWLADRLNVKGFGRKRILVIFTLIQGLLTAGFGIYLYLGGKSAILMGCLLFITSLFFNALQPIMHAMVSEIAQPSQRGSAFGMLNLFGETGAVLSPALGGTLRDAMGNWSGAVLLDAGVILISFVILLFVDAQRGQQTAQFLATAGNTKT
ncbi:MFS transporter [Alicyclobacillus vulcanalis]|uniref:Sugar phosphate permease n=1 Tax=Alicyclobacillus vulcanalis TaxID=252246 RepID=A0A1N7N428_9BACL|nr:MFS transporter [Alicyclobacillus vulcanalis]SIS93018.1 Sugar phosphate permease [Alicyclobacillus vulcanalis]